MSLAQWHCSSHSNLSHPFNFILSLPLCYSLNFTTKSYNEREQDFLYIWQFQRITLYQKRQKVPTLDTIEFLDKHVCISNPHWQSSGIIIFLCKYYIVISDTPVGSFFDALFSFATVVLSGLHEKPRSNKDWVTEKST